MVSTFYGNEISNYGVENGRVDYYALSKAFDNIYCDDVIRITSALGLNWSLVNGKVAEDDTVFQFYIVSEEGYKILSQWTKELVFYNEDLNIYVWGVTFYGSDWIDVLTEIEIESLAS